MLVVLDTNALHGDVRADRSRLRSILDSAVAKGSFELFVPEVVLQELDKQFARRSKKVVKDINKAVGAYEEELRELGLEGPPLMVRDDADIAGYRAQLESRLTTAGASFLPIPADLSPAVACAVQRRKPFKESGEGFQDAAIWLSVLDLARARDEEILLVSSNTNDFGDGKNPPGLADVLRDDLEDRGRPRDRVRLVPGIAAFATEVSQRLEAALDDATDLAEMGTFDSSIEQALLYTRLDQRRLELGIDLDSDPQVTGQELRSVTVTAAAELPGGHLLVEGTAEVSVVLDLLIYKADYWTADKSQIAPMTVTDDNFNEHYLEAETEIAISISIELSTSPEGEDVDVEIGDIELAPTELLRRALRGRSLDEFLDALRHAIAGEPVEDYVADTPIESEIQDVTVLEAYQAEAPHLREIVDTDGWRHVCAFDARASGDVEWVVTAPSPFDAESFASIALNEESGAPILQDHDSEVPLEVDATAAWDPEHGWHDFEVNSVRLDETEANERRSRPTRSEELLMDLADEQD